MSERFVVNEQGKFSTFQEEQEVPHGGVGSQYLSIKGGVTGFAEDIFLEKKVSGAQEPQTSSNTQIRHIHS